MTTYTGNGGYRGTPGSGFHIVKARLDESKGSYRCLIHEERGANQGYLETHRETTAVGIGTTPYGAIANAVEAAHDQEIASKELSEAISDLRSQLFDAEQQDKLLAQAAAGLGKLAEAEAKRRA